MKAKLGMSQNVLEPTIISSCAKTAAVGQIEFEGEPPFELVTQRDPIAIADEGFVVVDLAVFAAGYLNATTDVQIKMTMEHAAALALQLAPALAVAKEQADHLRAALTQVLE